MDMAFGGRILPVEDEEFTRSLLLDGLQRLGVEARGAATIAEALDARTVLVTPRLTR